MKQKKKVIYSFMACGMLIDAAVQIFLFLYCWYCICGYAGAGRALLLLVAYICCSAVGWTFCLWKVVERSAGGRTTRMFFAVLTGLLLLAIWYNNPSPFLLFPPVFWTTVLLSTGALGYYFLATVATFDYYIRRLQELHQSPKEK